MSVRSTRHDSSAKHSEVQAERAVRPVRRTYAEIVNSVKSKRTVSLFCDARFMQQLQAHSVSSPCANPLGTSVSISHPLSTDTSTPSTPSLSLTHPVDASVFKRRSRQAPWWQSLNGGEPLSKPARQYRKPAAWRDITDTLRVHYLHLALTTMGPVYSFSLNLRNDIEARALAQPASLDWLRRRIINRLTTLLGRPVQFYVVAEEDGDGHRLHLHGEMQITANEVEEARHALRLAGGEWKKVRQKQTHTECDPDAGWAGYVAKDFWRFGPITRPWLTALNSSYRVRFNGSQISRTSDLAVLAHEVYDQHRLMAQGIDPRAAFVKTELPACYRRRLTPTILPSKIAS
jgi:hypothetical protein